MDDLTDALGCVIIMIAIVLLIINLFSWQLRANARCRTLPNE